MNIINEFFVSFILIKLYFKFKVCRKIKFPLLWKFYFSKWKFYFSADIKRKIYDYKSVLELTHNLKRLDANDPIKYDFALYRLGQNKELSKLKE